MERSGHGVDFVQIGTEVVALKHIRYLEFSREPMTPRVRIWQSTDELPPLEFTGSRAELFTEWWDAHANVWVIEVKEEAR